MPDVRQVALDRRIVVGGARLHRRRLPVAVYARWGFTWWTNLRYLVLRDLEGAPLSCFEAEFAVLDERGLLQEEHYEQIPPEDLEDWLSSHRFSPVLDPTQVRHYQESWFPHLDLADLHTEP